MITLSKLHEFLPKIVATIQINIFISIGYQKKGWTCGEIRAEWIKIFDAETKDKVKEGEYRLLLVDGHNSHYTIAFLLYQRNTSSLSFATSPMVLIFSKAWMLSSSPH